MLSVYSKLNYDRKQF